MAREKMNYDDLSESAKYYRDHPKARKKKKIKDTEINKRPEQRKKRSQLVTERRKRGMYGNGGDDLSHEGGKLVRRSPKVNRGNSKNTQGDKNSRGKK